MNSPTVRFRPRGLARVAMAVAAAFAGLLAVLWLVGRYFPSETLHGPGQLLPPTGTLAIGRKSFHWVGDEPQSPEVVSHASGDVALVPSEVPQAPGPEPRARHEVMVHLWYPAQPTGGEARAPYIPGFKTLLSAVGEANLRNAAEASYDALSSARTHALADAPLCPGPAKFPVVLLTHGLRFNSLGYSMLCEDLASHGYLVVAVDHPATAFAVLFPDQRVVLFDEPGWTTQRTPAENRRFEQQRVEFCARDLVLVLDELEKLESGEHASLFQGRLDMARVGVFGHSFGGRVAVRACQLDGRLRAGILCDGLGRESAFATDSSGRTVAQPMMVQYARRVPLQGWARLAALLQTPGRDLEAELRETRQAFCRSVSSGCFEATFNLPQIAHESFSDMPLLETGQSATTHGHRQRAMEIARSLTRAFFDRYLREQPAPVLDDLPYGHEEVELSRHTFATR